MGERFNIVYEIHKPARRNFPRRYVTIKGLNDLYQADLVDMKAHAEQNGGYKYLLTMINAFSKRAWALPLKSKTGIEIARVLRRVFSKLDKPPKLLQVDKGSEFYNQNVAPVLEKYGIKLYSSYSELKATIIERLNRTLKTWMFREFTLQGNHKWVGLLDTLLEKYNSKVHRTIGLAPKDVNRKNEKRVLARLNKKKLPPLKKPKFKVGDWVRLSKNKHVFEKGYTANWTTEVYVIRKVKRTRPVTYLLKDWKGEHLDGGFYEEELLKTSYKNTYLLEDILKREKDRVFVKWLGFDKKHNQWVKLKDLVSS